jgi:hypothetical protein
VYTSFVISPAFLSFLDSYNFILIQQDKRFFVSIHDKHCDLYSACCIFIKKNKKFL